MKRVRGWPVALGLVLGILGVSAWRQITSFESEQLTDDLHVIYGVGGPWMASGNVAVLRTSAGPVVVDTMTFPFYGRWIQEYAAKVAGGPIQAVINTHFHQDHTHGNPAFPPGTRVVSTTRTREHLLARDAKFWEGDAQKLLPNETFDHDHEMRIGNKTIRAYHLGRGHTDGDLVALFVEDRVLMTGDLVWNHRYPNIDLEAGASVREWDGTLEKILALDFDRVIPGHGAVMDRDGVIAFQQFIRQLWQLADTAAQTGTTFDEFRKHAALTADAGFETIAIPFVVRLNRDFVLRRAYEEATGTVKATGP
jgi:cyclase